MTAPLPPNPLTPNPLTPTPNPLTNPPGSQRASTCSQRWSASARRRGARAPGAAGVPPLAPQRLPASEIRRCVLSLSTHPTCPPPPQKTQKKPQWLVIALAVFALALMDMFYPYNRGAMLSACVVLYALTAGVAGAARAGAPR
jgi:hypothetical protein